MTGKKTKSPWAANGETSKRKQKKKKKLNKYPENTLKNKIQSFLCYSLKIRIRSITMKKSIQSIWILIWMTYFRSDLEMRLWGFDSPSFFINKKWCIWKKEIEINKIKSIFRPISILTGRPQFLWGNCSREWGGGRLVKWKRIMWSERAAAVASRFQNRFTSIR